MGVVAATQVEAGRLVESLCDCKEALRVAHLVLFAGRISDLSVYIAISGVGKTNAGVASALLASRFRVEHLVSVGIAGAYPSSGLNPGDVAVASSETYADEGCFSQHGWLDMESLGRPLVDREDMSFYNTFPLEVPRDCSYPVGPFLTLSTVTGTKGASEALMERFPSAMCETMEGAAVAHVAAMFRLRCTEIRGVSNVVEDRDRDSWLVEEAAEAAQSALLELLNNRSFLKKEE
jgi:futalosine hydrolase